MCQPGECQNPEKLKGVPGDCSAEQVFECHGVIKDEEKENSNKE